MSNSRNCFVIVPYNTRGNQVYDKYIKTACDLVGYTPVRADKQLSSNIAQGIETSLNIAPMVIAYLGEGPNYNDNVILEVGYRFATRRPMVILCAEADESKEIQLPFHLKQERVIVISPNAESYDVLSEKINQIAKQMNAIGQEPGIDSTQPIAMIQCSSEGGFESNNPIFVEASELTLKLFGRELIGKSLEQFYRDRKADMPNYQYNAFELDQLMLVASCEREAKIPIIAEVPIIFKNGNFAGRAFLPIIVRSFTVGNVKELWVLYLDVTSVTNEAKDHPKLGERYYPCLLNPVCKPIQDIFRDAKHTQCEVGVFLAHNSSDKEKYVKPIYELLKHHKGKPWLDIEHIEPGEHWPTEIESAIKNCQAAIVFIGKNGLGPFQALELPALISEFTERGIRIIPVFLPDIDPPDHIFLRQFQGRSYDDLKNEKTIRDIVRGIRSNGKTDQNGWLSKVADWAGQAGREVIEKI